MHNQTIVRHLAAMGTALSLTVSAPTRDAALDASEAGVRESRRTERLLSTWRDDTPLARLNAAAPGIATPVPPELFALLKRVFEWEKATGGAFDPTVAAARDGMGTAHGRPHPRSRRRSPRHARQVGLPSSPSMNLLFASPDADGAPASTKAPGARAGRSTRRPAAMREAGAAFGLSTSAGRCSRFGEETAVGVAHPRDRARDRRRAPPPECFRLDVRQLRARRSP